MSAKKNAKIAFTKKAVRFQTLTSIADTDTAGGTNPSSSTDTLQVTP